MRIYLASTVPRLVSVLAAGELPAGPAFAVTPALREWYADGDDEELEYAALTEAARASLRLLDLDPSAPSRRVVLAADVDDSLVSTTGDGERASVHLTEAVPLSALVSGHVDDAAAEADVARAVAVVLEADLGSEPDQDVVDDAEGHDLLWFASQELDAWAQLLG